MKKALKILLIVILIIIIVALGFYAYLKIRIIMEEKRLKKEKSQTMQLDTDFKYMIECTNFLGGTEEFYEIDFENNTIKKIKVIRVEQDDCLYRRGINKLVHELEILEIESNRKVIYEKKLSSEDATELKKLLDDIIDNKVERNKIESKSSIWLPDDLYYKISTKNKSNINFNNKDLINQFLNLVK